MIRVGSSEDHGLSLAAIQIDGGTQSRATLNQHVVDDYAEAIKAGATFPPIVVFYDGKKHWLADGFHRFHAYQKAGKSKVAADVRQGTRRDAILHSVGANETHGLRRTRDDKRRAVMTLLNDAEWSKWTDREIGRVCQVHHETVGKLRPVTGETASERTYTTKHGTTATMKTAGINAGRTQFQAKASEDNGSITGGAGAVTGEASRLASGRTDAGEAASVDLPTNSDVVGDTDAIRAVHITQYHVMQLRGAWSKANAEARAIFLAEIQPSIREQADVDRSAERASSAVEVGAPVSPEGATQSGLTNEVRSGDHLISPPEAGTVGQVCPAPAESASDEISRSISPSAAHPVEAVADNPQVPRPSVTAPLSNPQADSSPVADKAEASTSSPSASATNPSPAYLAGDDGHRGTPSSDALAAGQGESPDSIAKSERAVTNPKPFVLRPHCLNPDNCAGYSTKHCHAYLKARGEAILADGAAA